MEPGYCHTVVLSSKKIERQRERSEEGKPKTHQNFYQKNYYDRLQKNLTLKFPKSLVFYALSCQSYGAPEKIV